MELEPLLPNSPYRHVRLIKNTIIVLFVVTLGLIGYFVVIPRQIQNALNSGTANVSLISIRHISVNSTIVHVENQIPISPPVRVYVPPTLYSLYINQHNIVSFNVSALSLPLALSDTFVFNSNFVFTDIPFITRFVQHGVKHGFSKTVVSLSANPRIYLSWFGSWAATIARTFVIDPQGWQSNPDKFDYPNVTHTLQKIVPLPDKSLDVYGWVNFTNSSPFSFLASVNLIGTLYYLNVPIVTVRLDDPILPQGPTNISYRATTNPRNTDILMQLVGEISQCKEVHLMVKDVKVQQPKVWIQDMVDGLEFPFVVPARNISDDCSTDAALFHGHLAKFQRHSSRSALE